MSETATLSGSIRLRPPEEVMRLARLGSFHQTRLSFMRVLLRRIAREGWRFERRVFEIDGRGVGHAVFTLWRGARPYSLIAYSHDLPPELRTDRVIAEAWDATYVLYDGVPDADDIARLASNVPRQEAGRCLESELVLARSNKSVRLFDAVVASLAAGRQPKAVDIETTGYLMRTTAVYGNGKFGIADRDIYADREELAGPFQAEMLTVWLIRSFTVDLAEHLARVSSPQTAVRLDPQLRRRLGIGNATGLGMAPYLIKHPALIDRWIGAREEALRRVRDLAAATPEAVAGFRTTIEDAIRQVAGWRTDDPVQAPCIAVLASDLQRLRERVVDDAVFAGARPWSAQYEWGAANLSLEGQEMLVSLLIEPHGAIVDDLSELMAIDERPRAVIHGIGAPAELARLIERTYGWALDMDFEQPEAQARFWYVSEEKLEPRLGERATEAGAELEQPLAIARDVKGLHRALKSTDSKTVAAFLRQSPVWRHVARRVLHIQSQPYGEVQDNLIGADLRAIDLLRCKLSFFGCTRFDPRSDKWLRITLFQGAPFPDEIGSGDWDRWVWSSGDGATT